MNTPDSQQMVSRLFAALQMLKDGKAIRGVQTFTRAHNINCRNLCHLGKEMANSIFQPARLSYLVQHNTNSDNLAGSSTKAIAEGMVQAMQTVGRLFRCRTAVPSLSSI